MAEVRKTSHIMCMHADDSSKRVYLTRQQAQSLLNRLGGSREKHKFIAYMTVELLEDGTRNNTIDCWAADDTHLAQIAYRGKREGWFICG